MTNQTKIYDFTCKDCSQPKRPNEIEFTAGNYESDSVNELANKYKTMVDNK